MKSKAILGLLFVLFASSLSSAEECSGFLQGSEDHVEVKYKQTFRRGEVLETVSVGEVSWAPFDMLGPSSCYDPTSAILMYKPVSSDGWKSTLAKQEASGRFSKWSIVDIKPCLQYEFQIEVSGSEEKAIFQIPHKLGPADPESIKQSDFVPDMPTDIVAEEGANSVRLSWKASDCAEEYEINYIESGAGSGHVTLDVTEEAAEIGDLKPCTSYDVSLYAILGEEYSDEKSYKVATKPRLDALSDLQPEIRTEMDGMTLRWAAWENVSCIDEYEVKVCAVATSECRETETVSRQQELPDVTFEARGLTPCTNYTVEIQPLFPDTEVEPKVFPFRTASPSAEDQSIGEISVESVTSGTMRVEWPALECATKYRIYANRSDEWRLMEETSENVASVDNITPCTLYRFAVSAVLDEVESPRTESEDVLSDLDEAHAFEAPELQVANGDQSADLTWLHAACIESYVVKVCRESECLEEAVIVEENSQVISHQVRDLRPCTQYTLEIIPIITDKTFTARINEFTTTNGVPQPPDNFELALNGDAIELSWDNVQCSTGFKIHRKEETSSEEETYLTSELTYRFEDPVPCEKYSFSVTTLVDEQESESSEWFGLAVPPRSDTTPELKVLSTDQDNVTLRLDPTDLNRKCTVTEVELLFGQSGSTLESLTTQDHKDLVIHHTKASSPSFIIKGRLLFEGSPPVWSAQVSNGNESGVSTPLTSSGSNTLIPIIVGVLIAVIILVVVAFLVFRNRRNRSNYDAEKAEHDRLEETQKLNDNHPDA